MSWVLAMLVSLAGWAASYWCKPMLVHLWPGGMTQVALASGRAVVAREVLPPHTRIVNATVEDQEIGIGIHLFWRTGTGVVVHVPPPPSGNLFEALFVPPWMQTSAPATTEWSRFGVRRIDAVDKTGVRTLLVSVPIGHLSAALAIFGLPMLSQLAALARRRRRAAAGLCMRCGYDLRATPGRCPECGAQR